MRTIEFKSVYGLLVTSSKLRYIHAFKATKIANCVAEGFQNRTGDPALSFYRFPIDPEMRKRWLAAVNRRDSNPREHFR
jgi:hypothetical protein